MATAAGERAHGTRARYVLGPGPGEGPGCHCEACRGANREYHARVNRLQGYGRWQPLVDAAAAREHVQALGRAGIGSKRVAALAGVSTGAISKLLYGHGGRAPTQRIRPETAAAILAVQPDPAPSAAVDATGTHRRLQALVAGGWSQSKLAERLGMTPANFGAMMRRDRVAASTAQATAAVYDQLWNRPPPETGQHEKIAASRARNHARKHEWAPPLAWDEEQLDAPDGKPAEGWRRSASTRRTSAELAEDAAEVMAQGHTIDQAAERLGVTRSAIEQAGRRAQAYAERSHDTQRARFAAAREAAQAPEIEREAG